MRRKEKNNEFFGEQTISYVRKLRIGYDNEDFILAFNEEEGQYENIFAIPAERLSEIIKLLFNAGMAFQKDNGVDIGFGTEEANGNDEGDN